MTDHPVVLTPGDPGDIRRLAAAIHPAPGGTHFGERLAAAVLAALAADDTVDACIYCGCPTADAQADSKPDQNLEPEAVLVAGNVGNARLIAELATRDRALSELRKELEHRSNGHLYMHPRSPAAKALQPEEARRG